MKALLILLAGCVGVITGVGIGLYVFDQQRRERRAKRMVEELERRLRKGV